MKRPKESDKPLQCEVEGDQLVIRIGIGTLAWAAKRRNGGPLPDRCRVLSKRQWAKDVADEVSREDEGGNTLLAKMLDKAMQAALERGSPAVHNPGSV